MHDDTPADNPRMNLNATAAELKTTKRKLEIRIRSDQLKSEFRTRPSTMLMQEHTVLLQEARAALKPKAPYKPREGYEQPSAGAPQPN